MEWKPKWVPLPILDFARTVHELKDDPQKCLEWVTQFADALMLGDNGSESELANELITRAQEAFARRSRSARKAGKASADARKNKSKEVAGNGNAPVASSNGLEEFNDQETASGNYQVPDKVSTNNGDAPHGDDGEDCINADNGTAPGTTTVSNPLALDMPGPNKDKATAKTRDNSASCRHASPSCSPEDGTNAAQPDSPANDQSDRHKRGREEPATDADIRKDSENMTDAGNGGELESGTSAAGDSFEAREMPSPGEGRKTFATGSSHPVANPPPPCVLKHLQKCGKQKQKANAQSPPRSSEDVRLFAIDKHLDVDDARLWYQMNYIDRPGCDKDGVLILNWKGHCTAYCKAEAERRKAG